MGPLEKQIKAIARENGAALVGIASKQRLSDAPPAGDPTYLLPSAQSIISIAIPYDLKALRQFFSKSSWKAWNVDKKEISQRIYSICDAIADLLEAMGFDTCIVDINNIYRPEPDAKDSTEIVSMVPDFSHRYGAIATGIGRLGWSGNLMTPEYGSAVMLGTVLSSAKLESDPLLEDNPCDECKMCVASCPVEMMHPKESVKVCWQDRKDRIENRKIIAKSGIVVLQASGDRSSVQADEEIIELETPFNLSVAFLKKEYEAALKGKIPIDYDKARNLCDREVLKRLKSS